MAGPDWSRIWLALTATHLTAIVVLEAMALRQPPPHPTYSRTLARWLGCHPRRPHRTIAVAAFAAAELVLAAHVARYREPT